MACVVSEPHTCSLSSIPKYILIEADDGKLRLGDADLVEWLMIAKQLFQGIQYMHFMGICHGDLQMSNIFCDLNSQTRRIERIYISDFGGSKVLDKIGGEYDVLGGIELLCALIDVWDIRSYKLSWKKIETPVILLLFTIYKKDKIDRLAEFLSSIGMTLSDSKFRGCEFTEELPELKRQKISGF